MARGRMINRTVSTDEKVAALGKVGGAWALVLHHRLIAFLDINGNTRADEFWIKATIFPHDEPQPADCRAMVVQLTACGLAVEYQANGITHLHFPAFSTNQPGLRPEKERPEWPAQSNNGQQPAYSPPVARPQPGNSTGEEKRREEKLNTGSSQATGLKGTDSTARPLAAIIATKSGGGKPEPLLKDGQKFTAACIEALTLTKKDIGQISGLAGDILKHGGSLPALERILREAKDGENPVALLVWKLKESAKTLKQETADAT